MESVTGIPRAVNGHSPAKQCVISDDIIRDIAMQTLDSINHQVKQHPTERWVTIQWKGWRIPYLFGMKKEEVTAVKRYFEDNGYQTRVRKKRALLPYTIWVHYLQVYNTQAPVRGCLGCFC